jgi:hypothetical protein
MIDDYDVLKEVSDAIAMLPEEYEETFSYLSNCQSSYERDTEPMDMVEVLLKCDCELPVCSVVSNLILYLLEFEIDKGNEQAMNELGALYYEGKVFEQDFSKALYYYKMAAENGCRLAQENLGYCYYYGRSVPKDYEKAFHYFALGAFDGHLTSLYKIGDMYLNGYYVQKNPTEALNIFEYCKSLLNDDNAGFAAGPVFLRLGNCYLNGWGTKPDYVYALKLYHRAEGFLLDMVKSGDVMYKNSLNAAIEGQAKAREQIAKDMPEEIWLDGKE